MLALKCDEKNVLFHFHFQDTGCWAGGKEIYALNGNVKEYVIHKQQNVRTGEF